jgi:formate hydrogenlyase subunit 6/NADH:ubiquinone oxidoreductase subunit I
MIQICTNGFLSAKVSVEAKHLTQLFEVLSAKGYQIIGPTIRDGAIVYDELSSSRDLPIGWSDEHGAGRYRLKKRSDEALFGYNVGPQSWKKYLHPPLLRLSKARRQNQGFQILEEKEQPGKLALIGVRACELHAIAIQDHIFLNGQYVDAFYKSRRENIFIVAVNCGQTGGTCFCVSMNTGPQVTSGFDLALTEVLQDQRHYFLVEAGSEQGETILQKVPHQIATPADRAVAERVVANAAAQMGRSLNTAGIKDLLYRNAEHPHWDEVASRCLNCANCTMACPTCFCTTVEDVTDLTGENAERWRKWDSCFTTDFSYIHGGSVRPSAKARYRQWLTHKLASWIDQFGTSGCVGCGRCITWCPVGIDITEEVRVIRENEVTQSVRLEIPQKE